MGFEQVCKNRWTCDVGGPGMRINGCQEECRLSTKTGRGSHDSYTIGELLMCTRRCYMSAGQMAGRKRKDASKACKSWSRKTAYHRRRYRRFDDACPKSEQALDGVARHTVALCMFEKTVLCEKNKNHDADKCKEGNKAACGPPEVCTVVKKVTCGAY